MKTYACLLAGLLACTHAPAVPPPSNGALELIESEPVETLLDDGGLREAWQVWPKMIAAAESSIDLAQFYVSDEGTSRLTPIIKALEDAVKRGVRMRFLADAGFAKTYPNVLEELAAKGAQVVKYDVKKQSGGVLHAKYFVVDEKVGYLGSQNFDWRSLQHIQELGVRFTEPHAVRALEDVFELDWALAQGAKPPKSLAPPPPDEAPVTLLEDPRGLLPNDARFELPRLVSLINSARYTFRVQTLTYAEVPELTQALERAAARGVKVQLLTSDWELRPKTAAALKALDPRIEVKILAIPQAGGAFIPFARVAHAKYCVADGERGVVSTSNWERDYFEKSRNVALLIEAGPVPQQLYQFFERNWTSKYAAPFDKDGDRKPPRISALP
jgi:phosphatidylserine/phosphatidylglycerophosphate/cardiolipin synthase-like enzyme